MTIEKKQSDVCLLLTILTFKRSYGVFTLPDIETETDEMAKSSQWHQCSAVSVQCEHIHTILSHKSVSVSISVSMSGSVNAPQVSVTILHAQ